MIAIAIFLTYSLQFYVPMDIIWKQVSHRFSDGKKNMMEYVLRITLIVGTVLMAVAIPNLGPFISLIGAVCLSTLGLMFPAIIEMVTFWNEIEQVGFNNWNWRLYKNLLLVGFGIIGFLTGTYVSIEEITEEMI